MLYAIDELKSYNDIIGWHIGNPNAEGKAYLNIFHNMPYATHVYHPNGADHTNSTIAIGHFLGPDTVFYDAHENLEGSRIAKAIYSQAEMHLWRFDANLLENEDICNWHQNMA